MPRTSIITPEKFITFGELLRFLRRKADLTQRELSIAVGYSESQISRLEQNERAPEEAMLAARFVPALYMEDEPQWVERLLELGTATHSHTSDNDSLLPIAEAKPTPHRANQGLGETALAQGNAKLATTHLAEALVLFYDLGDRAGVLWCLAGLAGVEALDEEPERAAWLWGAAEALRQSIGAREAPASRATHERLKAEVRKQLGEAAFNAKWVEGQMASVEQAISEATR